jgi:arylsulfatase A-like enzyme
VPDRLADRSQAEGNRRKLAGAFISVDDQVGKLLRALDRHKLRRRTLVIFSSDNGPVLDDGYVDRAQQLCGDHRPAGPLRGGKYSMYDGGTRVPLLLRWPERVHEGDSEALVSHVDFYASFARLVGSELPAGAAPDSFDVLGALLGEEKTGRRELVTEGVRAKTVLRQDDRVFIPAHEGPRFMGNTGNETGNSLWPQIYDLDEDIGQIYNRARELPEEVKKMSQRLQEIGNSEATRPSS